MNSSRVYTDVFLIVQRTPPNIRGAINLPWLTSSPSKHSLTQWEWNLSQAIASSFAEITALFLAMKQFSTLGSVETFIWKKPAFVLLRGVGLEFKPNPIYLIAPATRTQEWRILPLFTTWQGAELHKIDCLQEKREIWLYMTYSSSRLVAFLALLGYTFGCCCIFKNIFLFKWE